MEFATGSVIQIKHGRSGPVVGTRHEAAKADFALDPRGIPAPPKAQRRSGAAAQRRNGATGAAAQRRNGAAAQRRNGAAAQRLGGSAVWRLGGLAVWRFGDATPEMPGEAIW
jgi:hypothetical protein